MNWNAWFRQLGMKKLPQIEEMRPQQQLLLFGEEEMSKDLEVGHQLVSSMQVDVNILFAVWQQRQEILQDLGYGLQSVIGLYTVSQLTGRIPEGKDDI